MSGSSKLIKSQSRSWELLFWLYPMACMILVPQPWIEPESSQWKYGVLTTGLTTREAPCGYFGFVTKLGRSSGYPWDQSLVTGIWSGEQSCGTESLACEIWCYLQAESVRTELNCGTFSWCCRTAWWGKPDTRFVSEVCVCVCVCVWERERERERAQTCTWGSVGVKDTLRRER